MRGRQQKIQLELAFTYGPTGEARRTAGQGTEPPMARTQAQSTSPEPQGLMQEVCARRNLIEAYKKVKSNKGCPGVDGMRVDELQGHLKQHWPSIRQQLIDGTYVPQPVLRKEIDKPDGGKRKLGIPTVVDRFIQQAILQVLQRKWDQTFSNCSHGFRPGRSQRGALSQAQTHIRAGNDWVVDLDLEKFFDRVNHDILMSCVARRVSDKKVLLLIRRYLEAGVLEGGLISPTEEGTPQGGPLSPLLSNLLLDGLDKELEKRGLRFVRYADDCNIYVRSQRAGERVMASIRRFLEGRLKLKINEAKSAVARPWERKFLGFTFTQDKVERKISAKSIERFKCRVRELTLRRRSISLKQRISDLSSYLSGWRTYYGVCETTRQLTSLECWVRRRVRCCIWHSWKTTNQRRKELLKRGVGLSLARSTAASSKGPWPLSRCQAMSFAFPNVSFDSLGLPRLAPTSATS